MNKEQSLIMFLNRLKAKEEAENGPGAFEHSVAKGMLLLNKTASQLTPSEKAFLKSPAPSKRH